MISPFRQSFAVPLERRLAVHLPLTRLLIGHGVFSFEAGVPGSILPNEPGHRKAAAACGAAVPPGRQAGRMSEPEEGRRAIEGARTMAEAKGPDHAYPVKIAVRPITPP